jgi:hypothetical protein
MSSGYSFDTSMKKIVGERREFAEFSPEKSNSVPADEQSFEKMLKFCWKNSSLAYKVLKFYRDIEKLRQKLVNQEKTISLQAKAQAVICLCLYLVIFLAQWVWNPDLQRVLHSFQGKCILLFSLLLLVTGLWFVFRLSKTKSMEI